MLARHGPAQGTARGVDPGRLAAVVLVAVGAYAALSIDVVRTGFGIKSDEATYVAMALSVAHDGDLAFEAHDLERFYQTYQMGPEGIFLKRGAAATYRFDETFPFVRRDTEPDDRPDRLYFGKSFIASVAAAPFVRLAGLNGFLLFHVMLAAAIIWLGYRFLAAQSPGGPAIGYTVAFFAASIVPLYSIFLTSEMFLVACVFVAYFLWFYKEVAPRPDGQTGGFLFGTRSDVVGAVLLGLAIFAKPIPSGFLLAPPVAWALTQRRWGAGIRIGAITVVVAASGFAVNAGVSGEFNYQGGLDRRTYYAGMTNGFPFAPPHVPLEQKGADRATNEVVVEERLSPTGFVSLLGTNMSYFLVGRHFGFIPFFFPGVVTVGLLFWNRRSRRAWQWAIFGTAILSAVGMAIYMPYTWSGGGGPPGNRYFLSVYAAMFFLTPPFTSMVAPTLAGLGGSLFVAHILINPFVAAKQPYLNVERGLLRALPVELTMVNDLPIMNDAPRARVPYGRDPTLLLYYLDHNAYPPESPGIWVTAGRRADVIVRTDHRPLEEVEVTLLSRVANKVTVELGGDRRDVDVEANTRTSVTLVPRGVYSRRSWAYLLSVTAREGFIPRLADPRSRDGRYLGVAVTLDARRVP